MRHQDRRSRGGRDRRRRGWRSVSGHSLRAGTRIARFRDARSKRGKLLGAGSNGCCPGGLRTRIAGRRIINGGPQLRDRMVTGTISAALGRYRGGGHKGWSQRRQACVLHERPAGLRRRGGSLQGAARGSRLGCTGVDGHPKTRRRLGLGAERQVGGKAQHGQNSSHRNHPALAQSSSPARLQPGS